MIDLSKELKNQVRLVRQLDSSMHFEVTLPHELSYFQGHFPQMPILPAVGILDITSSILKEYLFTDQKLSFDHIHFLKVRNSILPGIKLQIHIDRKNEYEFYVEWKPSAAEYQFNESEEQNVSRNYCELQFLLSGINSFARL